MDKLKNIMKAYKGLKKTKNGKLMCRGMEYEPGKTYKYKGEIELCNEGFHACHKLHQVWHFYPNNGENVFYEVECGGDVIESKGNDGKFVCSEIKLIKPVDMLNIALFGYAGCFSDGFAAVKIDGKWNFINAEGKLLSEQWFDDTYRFSEGFAVVTLDRKYNFINTKGKMLSEQWFDDAWNFSDGFAVVKLNREAKKINTKGEFVEE